MTTTPPTHSPHSAPWLRSPSQTTPLITWAACSSYPFLRSRFQFADSLQFIQTSQSHFPMKIKGHLHLLVLQAIFTQPLVVHSILERSPCVALHCVQCTPAPELWEHIISELQLLLTSSAQFWMLCVQTTT